MMARNLGVTQSEESSCVVVQNRSFLRIRKEWRLIDDCDRSRDHTGPYHLIRTKHHSFSEARINDRLQISVKRSTRLRIHDDAHIDVDLGMRVEHSQQIIQQRVA